MDLVGGLPSRQRAAPGPGFRGCHILDGELRHARFAGGSPARPGRDLDEGRHPSQGSAGDRRRGGGRRAPRPLDPERGHPPGGSRKASRRASAGHRRRQEEGRPAGLESSGRPPGVFLFARRPVRLPRIRWQLRVHPAVAGPGAEGPLAARGAPPAAEERPRQLARKRPPGDGATDTAVAFRGAGRCARHRDLAGGGLGTLLAAL